MIAIYPGTFDPLTFGHQDIIERAARLFDKVIVAIADNESKRPLLSHNERLDLARACLAKYDNVEVKGFDTLLIDYAKQCEATVIVRGLRVASDFEYELQMANMNRHLSDEVETVFLTPSERFSYVSSTLVRELAQFGGDVSDFVEHRVAKTLAAKFS